MENREAGRKQLQKSCASACIIDGIGVKRAARTRRQKAPFCEMHHSFLVKQRLVSIIDEGTGLARETAMTMMTATFSAFEAIGSKRRSRSV